MEHSSVKFSVYSSTEPNIAFENTSDDTPAKREVPHIGDKHTCAQPSTAICSDAQRKPERPVGDARDGSANGEPEDTEPEEAATAADEQHKPRRKSVAEDAGDHAEVLADVVGDAEHRELLLVVSEHRLERMRVEREGVAAACRNLDPYRRRQPHPRRPRPSCIRKDIDLDNVNY